MLPSRAGLSMTKRALRNRLSTPPSTGDRRMMAPHPMRLAGLLCAVTTATGWLWRVAAMDRGCHQKQTHGAPAKMHG